MEILKDIPFNIDIQRLMTRLHISEGSEDATAIHGITTKIALEKGSDLNAVLTEFSYAIDNAQVLIAHNMDFDEKIVGAEFCRSNIQTNLFNTKRFCTMKSTTSLCKIPGVYGFKWPKLSELHRYLFDTDFVDAHNASIDVVICAKCFFELVNRGIIKLN